MAAENQENHIDAEEKKPEEPQVDEKSVAEDEVKVNGNGHVEEEDEEADESSDEEYGSVEAPAKILEGKRERKSTSRLAVEKPAEKKRAPEEDYDYEQGKGTKLGEIEYVAWSLNGDSIDDLFPMHKLLYMTKKEPKRTEVKADIKNFQGYPFDKDSASFKKRHNLMYKFTISGMRYLITSLGMSWKKKQEEDGASTMVNLDREEMIDNLIAFLMEPKDLGKKVPKAAAPATKTPKKKTPAKKPKTPKPKTPKPKTPKSKEKKRKSDAEDTEDGSSPAKKKKTESKKKTTQVKIKAAKSPVKKGDKKRSAADESEDDEPLVKKAKKKEPTDEEVRKTIKGILKDADLEMVTMKTVCKQVYELYPDHDMSTRKDFIKSTVKEIIS